MVPLKVPVELVPPAPAEIVIPEKITNLA